MELKHLTEPKEITWVEYAKARKEELAETKILWADLEIGMGKLLR